MRSRLPKAEHERECDENGLRRLSPQAPAAAQIPTKVVTVAGNVELRADLEDEFYGGFGPSDPGPGGGVDPKDPARRKLPRTTGFGGGSTSPSSVSGVRLHGNGRHRGGRRSLPGLHGPSPCGRSWRRTAKLYPGTGIQRAIAPNMWRAPRSPSITTGASSVSWRLGTSPAAHLRRNVSKS